LELPFEETWSDTCRLLERPLVKGKRLDEIDGLLRPMERELHGKVVLEGGRFYVKSTAGELEVHLVAEGLRKLATIAQLMANGSLSNKSSLFWDEPEANLNSKIIKQVARTILQLCQAGVQIFLATHSLFLMRELEILLKDQDFSHPVDRFIGLYSQKSGVRVEQGETFSDMGEIVALHEELSQSDRFMESERS